MQTRPTRPYPYERLAKLTQPQLALHSALRGLWDAESAQRALAVVRQLLGYSDDPSFAVELGVATCSSQERVAARLDTSDAALVLKLEHTRAALPEPWLVEISNRDAAYIVDRTLGGDRDIALAAVLTPLDELSRGTLAYVAARVLAALGGEVVLRDVVQLPLPTPALPQTACFVWPLWLRTSATSAALSLRLFVPDSSTWPPRPRPLVQRELGWLPLTLSAVAGSVTLPLTAATSLRRGDVLVLDDSSLVLRDGLWQGHVSARLPSSASYALCALVAQGLRIETFSTRQEAPMTTGRSANEHTQGPDFAADATLELGVEVARFSLSLAELQRLQPGDVLTTGRRIGERVHVRISGRLFAEGELVDVEGEVGVRLLGFADHGERAG
jgi:type III secretion system YscQ/HrcQ family protein